ncbi:hypothetical protein, partial [Salmonella enterica]
YVQWLGGKGGRAVEWGTKQCRVNYRLTAHKGRAGLYQMSGLCR